MPGNNSGDDAESESEVEKKRQSRLRLEVATRPDREGRAAAFAAKPMPSHPFSDFQPVLAFTVNTLIHNMIAGINLTISPPWCNAATLQDGANGTIGKESAHQFPGGRSCLLVQSDISWHPIAGVFPSIA